ncbi:MAG: bifunctional (p)ppGpp synthetase/guanosine-3',5'-bis(diphosphate) 3'-pyrophosphohydrolase [Alcaligenaceae bacterium]|nr:bifunctional (p)ppGpp synthetase/guanosine-3',5'-bis(diphosphate) 3'-pyrophosphohydrolase [Alcaligenaceae bacterium]
MISDTHNNKAFDDEWLESVCVDLEPEGRQLLEKVVSWARPIMAGKILSTEEPSVFHAAGVVKVLSLLQMDATTIVSGLIAAMPIALSGLPEADYKNEIINQFGLEVFNLVQGSRALVKIGEVARNAGPADSSSDATQQEMLRKMLLAMATDLRIVLIRLASRLQTLRWFAETKKPCPASISIETRDVYAPLANRLGIWQIKWEMEDLSFRFLEPEVYKDIAKKLESKRVERESHVAAIVNSIQTSLQEMGIKADVAGRAKHIYSIYNKMRNKNLDFDQLYDLQALRIIVDTERDCYTALSLVHAKWTPVMNEYDDYIARPKPNGYRSLHTVVRGDDGRAFEVQIRTWQMHQFAEYGMAAHWRYKEAGAKGGEVSASSLYDRQVSWMRQLLSWRKEVGITEKEEKKANDDNNTSVASQVNLERKKAELKKTGEKLEQMKAGGGQERIYVLTPQARVIELSEGSTPVDFAYHLHTDLGHRCRGARVDGQLVALNTKLQTGQTVEIIAAKSGGPSRDWLNAQLGYLASPRARAKVRLWFNAIELQKRITAGQEQVEKELQRLGKTAVNQEQLAGKLGFASAEDLYVAVAKDEFGLRGIAAAFVEPDGSADTDEKAMVARQSGALSAAKTGKSGVLVVGVDSLMTQLARCCHPAPPDDIAGFVTRGRGVSIHRQDCKSFAVLAHKSPERVIDVAWGNTADTVYPVNIAVHAHDRNSLLRDISEAFSRLKLNVTGVNTQSRQSLAHMNFTIEIKNGEQLSKALQALSDIPGVISAERC